MTNKTALSILIEADDQASKVIASAAEKTKKVEAIKEKHQMQLLRDKVLYTEGAEAVEVLDLMMQGLDETTARLMVTERKQVDELKKLKQVASEPIKLNLPTTEVGTFNKEMAKGTKSSVEFFGVISSFAGAGEVGALASQVAGLTEKTSALSEMQDKGGASTLLWKAGLVAGAGAVGFAVGKYLGDAIFQVEKWNKTLEEESAKSAKLTDKMLAGLASRLSESKIDIELIRDPEEKRKSYEALLEDTKTNLMGVESQLKNSRKSVEEWDKAWQITGDRKGYAQQAKDQLEQDQKRADVLREQRDELVKLLGVEAEREKVRATNNSTDYLDSLRQQLELEKASADQRLRLDASKVTIETDTNEAVELLKQIEAIQNQKAQTERDTQFVKSLEDQLAVMKLQGNEAERLKLQQQGLSAEALERVTALRIEISETEKLHKLEDDRINQAKRLADQRKAEVEKLRDMVTETLKGKDAMAALRLERMGFGEAEAKHITDMQKLLSAPNGGDKPEQANAPLQATISRTLLRGPREDMQSKQLKAQEENTKQIMEMGRKLDDIAKAIESGNANNEVVLKGVKAV